MSFTQRDVVSLAVTNTDVDRSVCGHNLTVCGPGARNTLQSTRAESHLN